ncbi:MAG: hypothetical protein AMXMBFR13_12140 [Phycisphaerae bacterium]
MTFGIQPTAAHTGYGYIHLGEQVAPGVREVRAFKEKPDRAAAEGYLASGEYAWNSGMFVWRIATILDEFRRHQPATAASLHQIAAGFHDPGGAAVVQERFAALPRISVDLAIMEKAERVLSVDMTCQWLDVGAWTALAEVFPPDERGNTLAAPNVVTLDASGNILACESDHLIAVIGVEDLVVIHSDDATLICRKQDAQKIKDLVELVQRTRPGQYR